MASPPRKSDHRVSKTEPTLIEPMQGADTNLISPIITTSSLEYQVQKEHFNLHLLEKAAQGV